MFLRDGELKKGKMSGACSTHERDKNAHKLLVEKPEGRRKLRRTCEHIGI